MKRRKPLEIAGERIRPGVCELQLKFGESYFGAPVGVPIYVMRARRNGPRVFVTGTLHGDEMNGMGIVRELLYDKLPKLQRGTLILIPVVNIHGLERHSRYMPDRRDLNRCFPGSERGSVTSRLAHSIFTEIVKQCDFGIDFHTAAVRRTNFPNVRGNVRDPATKQLALDFGCELIVNSRGPRGSLRRTAVDAGVPTIILEAGEVWKIEPAVVEIGVRGCLNVLKRLDMIEGEPERPAFQTIINQTVWLRSEVGGILGFHARPGQFVSEFECLATSYSLFGQEQTSLLSPADGIVLGMTTMPAVASGAAVYHIAKLNKKTLRRLKRESRKSSPYSTYSRLQRDLTSKMPITEEASGR